MFSGLEEKPSASSRTILVTKRKRRHVSGLFQKEKCKMPTGPIQMVAVVAPASAHAAAWIKLETMVKLVCIDATSRSLAAIRPSCVAGIYGDLLQRDVGGKAKTSD